MGVKEDDGHGLFDFWQELEATAPGKDPFSQRVRERGRRIYERMPSGASIGSAGGVGTYPLDLQRLSRDP